MVEVIANASSTAIDVDNAVDVATGIRYIGTARRGFDGRWRCLAQVSQALCIVEVSVRPIIHVDQDPGDEDAPRATYGP